MLFRWFSFCLVQSYPDIQPKKAKETEVETTVETPEVETTVEPVESKADAKPDDSEPVEE